MLIGAMSDTHGRRDTTAAAIRLFAERRVDTVLHMGDVGSAQVIELLAGMNASFVWGNCDYDRKLLERHALALGVKCYGAIGRMSIGETIVTFMHGDDHRQMAKVLEAQDCDLLLHGHTHVRTTSDAGRIRIVNPGALHRANPHGVAIIDATNRAVEFIDIHP